MNHYTVLFTCARGYNCFRSVFAANEEAARTELTRITHNLGEITEVRPYVGA